MTFAFRRKKNHCSHESVAARDTHTMKFIQIRRRWYDVGNFHHPGGSVIATHAWSPDHPVDATNAFEAFHFRSTKAHSVLSRLPSAPFPPLDTSDPASASHPASDPVEDGYGRLCGRLVSDGYFAPSLWHVAYRISTNACMWWAGSRVFAMEGPASSFAGMLILAVAYVQCGWIQHECGHGSFTCIPRIDRLLQLFYLNILMGGNYRFWNDQHFSHHANTQNATHDKDLKTFPLVAFHELSLKGRGHTVFTRHQHRLYWWLINPLVWAVWSFASHPSFARRRNHVAEYATTKAISLSLFYLLVFPYHTCLQSVALFHLTSLLGTTLLLATFTVSHTTTDAYTRNKGWVRPASEHTVNIADHWLTNWWMGYLNFQIEHHLFPTMPQFRQGEVGRRYTRPYFSEAGIPYTEKRFWRANADVYRSLKRVSRSRGE